MGWSGCGHHFLDPDTSITFSCSLSYPQCVFQMFFVSKPPSKLRRVLVQTVTTRANEVNSNRAPQTFGQILLQARLREKRRLHGSFSSLTRRKHRFNKFVLLLRLEKGQRKSWLKHWFDTCGENAIIYLSLPPSLSTNRNNSLLRIVFFNVSRTVYLFSFNKSLSFFILKSL